MSNFSLCKNYTAGAAIPAWTIVKNGAVDYSCLAAAAVTDSLLGVTTEIPAATGERCDVLLQGLADVIYGGTVTRGDFLTTDSLGRAVTANPAAGVNNWIIGMAFVSGVLGDIGSVILSQGKIQG